MTTPTADPTADPTTDRPDTHDMVIVHRAFRRESLLLASLIGAVPDGDTVRAGVLATHLRWYRLGLHNHHHGEDELIWPPLLARADLESDVVVRMEAQHVRVAESLDRVMLALPEWQGSAGRSPRQRLVAALGEHREALIEHLDDEETHLLPLAERHLTRREWGAMGDHFLAATPKSLLLSFLGAILEEADPVERGDVLGAMPTPARLLWHTVGRALYARRIRRVRGRR
ncbi:hypothetical protein GCM10023322_05230 [Rugosimonospora acidiphila]|uniref:Hemerythrin-like domain-containing protein n=1 Tax=Rugosimonospora acidiphila TaxID=556531 RepID=A0ABP9RK02_9ACTN